MIDPNVSDLPRGPLETPEDGGVPTQTDASTSEYADNSRAESIPASEGSDWPTWAPTIPGDLPPPAWEAEGRDPRPEELIGGPDEPARAPSDYRLPAGFAADAGDQSITMARAVQSLLWHADMPARTGAALLEAINDAARRHPGEMEDAAFKLKFRETELTLKRQMGEAEYTRCRAALGGLFDQLDVKSQGNLSRFLDDHAEVFLDPMVQLQLLRHAGRLEHRRRRG